MTWARASAAASPERRCQDLRALGAREGLTGCPPAISTHRLRRRAAQRASEGSWDRLLHEPSDLDPTLGAEERAVALERRVDLLAQVLVDLLGGPADVARGLEQRFEPPRDRGEGRVGRQALAQRVRATLELDHPRRLARVDPQRL